MTIMDIINQLVNIYFKYEHWQKNKMPYDIAYAYHKKLYELGNMQIYEEKGKVLGYVEFWLINFEQFGRIICHETFYADGENVIRGNIAFVANVWVDPQYRNSYIIKELKLKFFKNTFHCDYFVGEAIRKTSSQPIKVFRKSDLSNNLFLSGELSKYEKKNYLRKEYRR